MRPLKLVTASQKDALNDAMKELSTTLGQGRLGVSVSMESGGFREDLGQDNEQIIMEKLKGLTSALNGEAPDSSLIPNTGFESADCEVYDLNGKSVNVQRDNFQYEAAAISLMAGKDTASFEGYVESFLNVSTPSNATAVQPNGVTNISDVVSAEAYDNSNISNFTAANAVFNGGGARQDDFAETLYPTKVLPNGSNGFIMTVERTVIQRNNKRNADGTPLDMQRIRLISAKRNDQLLKSRATEMIPAVTPATENQFVAGVRYPDEAEGVTLDCGFLKAGTNVDLLTVTAHPDLVNNKVLDTTDAIDPPLGIKELLIQVTDTANSVTEMFIVDAADQRGSEFELPQTGQNRDSVLNWDIEAIVLRSDSKGKPVKADNSASTLFATASPVLKGYIGGKTNYETGTTHVNETLALHVTGGRVVDVNGNITQTDLDDTAIDGLNAFEFKVIGWTPKGTRTNLNLRKRGTRLETESRRFVYQTPFRHPLTVVRPTSDTRPDASAVRALIAAANIENSGLAVQDLELSFKRGFDMYRNSPEAFDGPCAEILDPYFEDVELDFDPSNGNVDLITNTSLHRARDLTSILQQNIRSIAENMRTESNIQAAIESGMGGSTAPLTLNIATDPQTARYLIAHAGDSLTSLNMDTRIVTTTNTRMRDADKGDLGHIYLTFSRPGAQSVNTVDVLSYGFFNWIPAATYVNDISKDGQHSKEITVQPRAQHYAIMPVMGHITVKNLLQVGASLKN